MQHEVESQASCMAVSNSKALNHSVTHPRTQSFTHSASIGPPTQYVKIFLVLPDTRDHRSLPVPRQIPATHGTGNIQEHRKLQTNRLIATLAYSPSRTKQTWEKPNTTRWLSESVEILNELHSNMNMDLSSDSWKKNITALLKTAFQHDKWIMKLDIDIDEMAAQDCTKIKWTNSEKGSRFSPNVKTGRSAGDSLADHAIGRTATDMNTTQNILLHTI